MFYIDGGLGFSDGTDVVVGADISRTLYALKNRMRITPAAYMNMGTQKYYNEYML